MHTWKLSSKILLHKSTPIYLRNEQIVHLQDVFKFYSRFINQWLLR